MTRRGVLPTGLWARRRTSTFMLNLKKYGNKNVIFVIMTKKHLKIFGLALIFTIEVFMNDTMAGKAATIPIPPIQQGKEKSSTTRENSNLMLNESPDQILKEIRDIEYSEISYDQANPNYFGFIPGSIPILISAPHGAKHYRTREHRWKGEDEYTASLAIELGKLTGAYVIYVKNKTSEDPNSDASSRYKKAVAQAVKKYHIKFMLDLHGSDETRPYKVDIGIISDESGKGSCPTYKQIIRSAFSDFEHRIFNQRFCAKDQCTMTSFARNQLGIEAAQVEINAKYRVLERKPDSSKAKAGIEPHFKANGQDVLALVTRLKGLILEIDQKIENKNLLSGNY